MSTDLWAQLANSDVPAPPAEFDRQVHGRINKNLLVQHLLDLGLQGMLFALGHFALAWLHLVILTLTGKVETPRKKDPL